MRTHTALALVAAFVAISLPAQQIAAQRGRRGVGGARGEALIPHEPARREPAHAAPIVEPGRPTGGLVPYVRDNHWYGHAAPNDARFHLARPFEFGRFAEVGPGHHWRVARYDLGARRIWLPGGQFEIADWEWAATAPWCWTCDDFVVYLDPDHSGWYLIYDVRMREYVHARFLGA